MNAPTEFYPAEMGELIETLAEYNDSGNAIGYSVYYYANYMYSKPGLKFLAINGVVPSDVPSFREDTPSSTSFTPSSARTSRRIPRAPDRELAATPQGKELIRAAGYVPTP